MAKPNQTTNMNSTLCKYSRNVFFMNLLCRLILLVLSMTTFGCRVRVEYSVENLSTNTLDQVIVVSESGHSYKHGVLIPMAISGYSGGMKTYSGGMKTKAENVFSISWKDEREAYHVDTKVSRTELTDPRIRSFAITTNMTVEKRWFHQE